MNAIRLAVLVALAAPALASADKALSGGKGVVAWDCKTDPVVTITGGSGRYALKGACTSIHLTGGHNTLAIESVDALDITGASNTITVDAVDAVNINGAENKVRWKKGKSGAAPQVSQLGQNNSVARGS